MLAVTDAVNNAIDENLGSVIGKGPAISVVSKDEKPFKFVLPKAISGESEDKIFNGREITMEPSVGAGYTLKVDGETVKRRLSKEEALSIMHSNSVIGNAADDKVDININNKSVVPKRKKDFLVEDGYTHSGIESTDPNYVPMTSTGSYSSSSGINTPPPVQQAAIGNVR